MKQSKTLAITGIQRNQPQGTNEACDELINMRFQDGAWRPVGVKATKYALKPSYNPIVIHKKDNINNWIGFDSITKTINHYNPATLDVLQVVVTLNGTETLNAIRFVKQFLIVITTENLYRYLWKNNTYTMIVITGIENNLLTQITQTDEVVDTYTDYIEVELPMPATKADEFLGKYYKLLKEQSDLGRYNGGFFYRTVIKLFDGSEILHTLPAYYQFGDVAGYLSLPRGATINYFRFFFSSFASISVRQSFVESVAGEFDLYKELIQSVVVYASRVQSFYDISPTTINKEDLDLLDYNPEVYNYSDVLPVSPLFKTDMHDSTNWYKIGEVSFNKLVQDGIIPTLYQGDVTLDIKGFYDNFATHELMDPDNFSHHDLTGNASDIYNDRLELGDTRQLLGLPSMFAESNYLTFSRAGGYVYEFDAEYEGLAQVKLDTSNGVKYVEIAVVLQVFQQTNPPGLNTKKAVYFPGIIGYPDYRAVEIIINIKIAGTYYEIYRSNLEKSTFGNFAFVINKEFDETVTNFDVANNWIADKNFYNIYMPFDTLALTANTIQTVDNTVIDNNRVQISEVNNPFVFPAKNSQQVSVGIIKAFGTSTEETSQGQFGMFPIYCFTSVGIWGLEVGAGDVYITRVVPINGEVIRDNAAKLDLSFGIAYISAEGLRIIAGKEVIEISETVEGMQDETLSTNANLQFFINHAKIVQMVPYVDKITFLNYLASSVLGYNKGSDNNELIVMNPNYDYSYVFDIKNKSWFKMTGKYSSFIADYPLLYGVNEDGAGSVHNFSSEGVGTTQCLFITRAHSYDAFEVAKKLRRTFLRCFLNVTANHFAAFYIFRSDNLIDWTYETGNDRNSGKFQDIWATHTFKSARYYAFVFAASLEVDRSSIDNRISFIKSEFELKMEGKLR